MLSKIDSNKNVFNGENNTWTITFPLVFPNNLLSLNSSLKWKNAFSPGNCSIHICETDLKGGWGLIDIGYGVDGYNFSSTDARVFILSIGY